VGPLAVLIALTKTYDKMRKGGGGCELPDETDQVPQLLQLLLSGFVNWKTIWTLVGSNLKADAARVGATGATTRAAQAAFQS
jgi:hypothetical protein